MARRMCTLLLGVLATGIGAASVWLPDAAGQAPREKPKPAARQPALKPGQIDLEKSRVYILVGKKGLGHEHGVEGKIKSGSIDLNARKNFGEIEFDMTSFVADTDEARQYVDLDGTIAESTRDKVTETMLGTAVLDVEQFPTASFKVKSLEVKKSKSDEERVLLKGDFTLHGQTRPLAIDAELEKNDGSSHLRGEFTILQSDFKITPYKAALGTVGVADKLRIWGDIRVASEVAPKTKKK